MSDYSYMALVKYLNPMALGSIPAITQISYLLTNLAKLLRCFIHEIPHYTWTRPNPWMR